MNDFAMARRGLSICVGIFAAAAIGCAAPAAAPPTTVTGGAPHAHAHDAGDHNHSRGKMLLASDGTYNALLTAHLSAKDGNELDIFVENKDGPYALAVTKMEATARIGEGENRTVSFACAPANERPTNEAEGTCSHFVALAPWMRVGEVLRVETALPIRDKKVPMTWRDFEPKKYAHHEE